MNKKIFKKLLLYLFLFSIFFITSCQSQNIKKLPDKINTSFIANCEIIKDDFMLKCSVTSTQENIIRLYVYEPIELKGLTFELIDDTYKISYEGLSFEKQDKYLPKTSFVNIIFNSLKEISNLDNLNLLNNSENNFAFSGTCDSGYFTVNLNKENLIESILFKDINTEIIFNNYT